MKYTRLFSLALLSCFVLLFSCKKEMSFEADKTPAGNPPGNTNGGVLPSGSTAWSFNSTGNTNYYGCVDTAFYETMGGLKTLAVIGSDSAGNQFGITLVSLSGNFTATTYTPATGGMMVFGNSTGDYTSSTPGSFSIQVTAINDTLLTGSFTANLTDVSGGGTFAITSGTIKAYIGKPNPCPYNTVGSGGNGNTGGPAEFTLLGSNGVCGNINLLGTYQKGLALTQGNTISLDVDVTKPGDFSINTAPVNGFSFSTSGTFYATGTQTIVLDGTGTPTAATTTVFPLTAGSSTCSFSVPVDTVPTAPCNPTNNTLGFSVAGIGDISFYGVSTTLINGYTITANGNNGDLRLVFTGTTQPDEGVYNIKYISGFNLKNEVGVDIVAANILWQPASEGKLYVKKVNGKIVATFCDMAFSGSLGGPSFNTKVTAKITEE